MKITTEDGFQLEELDRAYDYYNRQAGHIGQDVDSDGWFTFHHDDGTTTCLNGARICTVQFAQRKGWM